MGKTKIQIPEPSVEKVEEKWLDEWKTNKNYTEPDEMLKTLFTKTYPQNDKEEHVFIKVCTLNTVYSTNIWPSHLVPITKLIVSQGCRGLNFDKRLADKKLKLGEEIDLELVNDLGNKKIKTEDDNEDDNGRRHYSFATKYCSFHNPEVYPIYDSYVRKMLIELQKQNNFLLKVKEPHKIQKRKTKKSQKIVLTQGILEDYEKFYKVHKEFRKHYKLGEFSSEKKHTLKEIDQYLWLTGKFYLWRYSRNISEQFLIFCSFCQLWFGLFNLF